MLDLNFVRGQPWETHGRMKLSDGLLNGPNNVLVRLGDSQLTFTGRPQWPEINIKGTADVARTRIDITVRGTRKDPKLELSSDPPHTKEQLLMMLATGKAWSGMDEALATNKMTPELTADFIEYVFFRNKRWEFSIPLQIGIGNTHYEYHYGDHKFRNNWSVIINYEASISGHYKILKWFGVGAGIGYQLMLKDNPAIKENFNTPVYSIKLKIFLGDIYKSVFPPKKNH